MVDLAARRSTGRALRCIALDHFLTGLTLAVATGLLAAVAWRAGVLDDWYELAIRFNSQVYSPESDQGVRLLGRGVALFGQCWHWYTAFALLGAVLWARSGDRPLLLLLATCLVITFGSVVVQGKGFEYHYGGCLIVLGALVAHTLACAGRWMTACWPAPILLRVAGAGLLAVAVLGMASKFRGSFGDQVRWHLGWLDDAAYYEQYDAEGSIEVARYLLQHTGPADAVWTYDPYLLANNLAGRRMPLRFTCYYFVQAARPPLAEADRWLVEIESALRDSPPRYIVLRRSTRPQRDGRPDYRTLHADDDSQPARMVRGILARRYHLARSIHQYDLYELKDQPRSDSTAQGPSGHPV
jgi:hypothetical protein